MDGYILSIDQGTSGSKAIIFDHAGNIVASSFREVTQYYPHQGWVEQDANEIWQTTLQAIAETLKNARILPEDICAIGISNQRCTTVLWNKLTGEPIGRAIIWQDRRSQLICDRLTPDDRKAIGERNGLFLVPNISATKIQWLMEEDRSVQKAITRGEVLFGTIDSWLIWKLSGGTVHVTDYSNASTAGLLNSRTLEYDEWIRQKFGIPREILPELKSSSEIYAYTQPQVFFGASIPISGCAGDQVAAAFGQACFKPGMIKNTYGTGSFMILNVGHRPYLPGDGVFSPVLWTIKNEVAYGLEGYADVSGTVIQWLRDGLGLIRDISEADGLAIQVPDTQGVYFVPALVGLGAPHQSPNARGTIFGINQGTHKNHFVRAALEALAYQMRDAFEIIEHKYGSKFSALRVDGGGAKSDFLMQFQADILGVPVERPTVVETSALGAAYLAGLAIGYWQSMDEIASNWQLDTRFEPRISATKREDLYAGWLHAIECAKSWGTDRSLILKKEQPENRLSRLSPREREVVDYIVAGKSTREIATILYTSVKTVEKQRRDAMRKLGVETLAGLVRICLESGQIKDP
jgi:glycerol kinase